MVQTTSVLPAAGTNAAGTASGSANAIASLGGTFDNYLKLLTTQLANQDPLSPLDANEFTSELVQFTQVEQTLKGNDKLDRLITLLGEQQGSAAIGYLGRQVDVDGATILMGATGGVDLSYTLPETAAEAKLKITDATGRKVAALPVAAGAGAHVQRWNGVDAGGRHVAAGTYTMAIAARDAGGTAIPVDLRSRGVVDAVERRDGDLFLSIGGHAVPLGSVVGVTAIT